MRSLIRKRNDTSAIWGDLARVDYLDTDSRLRRGLSRYAFILLGGVLVLSIALLGLIISTVNSHQPNAQQVYEKAKHSLVGVSCGKWQGSGVAISLQVPDSYGTGILSAAHIFDDCKIGDTVEVTHEGEVFKGKLAKRDPETGAVPMDGSATNDLALIYVKPVFPTLEPAPEAKIGDWTMALGNPGEFLDYLTLGIVSNSDADTYASDAPINHGNSGGPLLDAHARVLGIMSYSPIEKDSISQNKPGLWTDTQGISVAVRLRMACPVLLSNPGDCPFTN